MYKLASVALILLVLISQAGFSQDMAEYNPVAEWAESPSPADNDGLYRQPRWVTWPAWSLHLNVLGFAETGPVMQAEIQLHEGLYLVPGVRYNYLGYASNNLMTSFDSASEYSPASYGLSLGVRQLLGMPRKNNLAFVGLFAEYSQDKAYYNMEPGIDRFESERIRQAVTVVANFGYRWWFRNGFFVHTGIYGGISFEIKDESRYMNGALAGDLEKDFKNTPFAGLIDLSVGWRF